MFVVRISFYSDTQKKKAYEDKDKDKDNRMREKSFDILTHDKWETSELSNICITNICLGKGWGPTIQYGMTIICLQSVTLV